MKSHMEQRRQQEHEQQTQAEQQERQFKLQQQQQMHALHQRHQHDQMQLQMRQQTEYNEILKRLTVETAPPVASQPLDPSQQQQLWPAPAGYGPYSAAPTSKSCPPRSMSGWTQQRSHAPRYAPYQQQQLQW